MQREQNKYNVGDMVYVIQGRYLEDYNGFGCVVWYIDDRKEISKIIIDATKTSQNVYYSFNEINNGNVWVKENDMFDNEIDALRECNNHNVEVLTRSE